MSDAPDLEALARRYLDLWQDQMNRMAGDPAMAEALSRTLTIMTRGAETFAAASKASGSTDGASTQTPPADGTDAAGTAAAAPVPGAGGVDLAQLLRRIDALEKRVAELEGRTPAEPAQSRRRS